MIVKVNLYSVLSRSSNHL